MLNWASALVAALDTTQSNTQGHTAPASALIPALQREHHPVKDHS